MAEPTQNSTTSRPPRRPGGSTNGLLWAASLALLIIGGVIWYFIVQERLRTEAQLQSLPPAPADTPLISSAPPATQPTITAQNEPDPASLLEVSGVAIGPHTLHVRIRNGSQRGLRSAHVVFFASSDLKHPFAELNIELIGPRRTVESEVEVNGLETLVPVGQAAVTKVDASDFTAR